ncbi:MAG: hypothetical protein ACRDEA_07295, partial [Microcystaceae cyanobacterium]
SQLNDMLGDGTFVQWLHQNVTSKEGGQQLLENMLDQGTMSKLPMTTREVMTYLTDNLELPFKVADKSFIDDPMEMVNRYTEVLKEAAQDAAVSKLIVTEGLDHGWAVLPKNYKPEIHTDFVKVSADDVRTAFSDWKGGDIWMRKVVFNNWKATLEMVQNPNLMGHFGNVMNHVTNFFNKAVLLQSGVGYPVKVFADSIRAFNTAGGNMLRMWEGFHDINRVFSKGTAALENTKAVYGIGFKDGLTERGAFEKFIMHRQFDLSPNTPGIKSGGKFPTIKNLAKDGKALFEGAAGGVQYAFHYANAFGWDAFPDIAKMPFSSVDKVQKEAFSYLATMANYAEMTTKWALIKSLTDGSDTGKIFAGTAQLLGGIPEFKSWDEVYRYVDDNFFNWQTSGVLPKYASIVKPFAVFSMKSTPAALRMAMRRPQAFVNYMRLRSFMTQQATEDDPNLNQGTVPDWLLETSPIFLFNDKATGQYGALLSGSWNAFEDSWNFMGHGLPQMIDDLTGQDTGRVEHRRDLMKQDRAGAGGRLQQFVKDMVSQSTAPIENLMSLV